MDGAQYIDGLSSKDPKVKYGCAKALIKTAREDPASLYPRTDLFIDLLGSDNRILKWTAIDIIGNLSRVDDGNRVDPVIERINAFLDSGEMITANHAISALSEIARAKPRHRERIAQELLKVERYTYDTEECRNIALGKVILALNPLFDGLNDKERVLKFIARQTQNGRGATRKKAEKFLKQHSEKGA